MTTTQSTVTVDWAQGTVLIQDGRLFCSPNCNRLVTIPDPELARTSPFHSPQAITTSGPVWWDWSHGWLSFVPLSPSFLSLPFEPLCWKPRVVQTLVRVRGESTTRFTVDSDDSFSWTQRETALVRMANELRLKYHINGILPPLPSSFGLLKTHNSRNDMDRSVAECRRWFAIWMGFISYLIAQTTRPQFHKPATGPHPGWHQHLLEKGFLESWLNGITGSSICDFSSRNRRSGVIIPFSDRDEHRPPAEWFVAHHIPIWYPLTRYNEEVMRKDSFLCKLLPPADIIQEALRDLLAVPKLVLYVIKGYAGFEWKDLEQEASRLLNLTESSSMVMEICAKTMLLPAVHSCIISWNNPSERIQILEEISSKLAQRESELKRQIQAQAPPDQGMVDRDMFQGQTTLHAHWQDFFSKRDKREIELLASESMKDKQVREQREKQRPTGKCRMFTWERIVTSGGSHVYARTLARRSEHSDLVKHYRPQETKYYARHSEWDFFEDFDISHHAPTPYAFLDEAGSDDEGECEQTVESTEQNVPAFRSLQDKSVSDDASLFALPIDSGAFETTAVVDDYAPESSRVPAVGQRFQDDRILERAMWQFGYVPALGQILPDGKYIPWIEVLHILGCSNKDASVDESNMRAMRIFFASIVQKSLTPSELDDLSRRNRSYLLSQIGVDSFTLVQHSWYVFHTPRSESCTWLLGVDSAAVVLYILRVFSTYRQHTIFTLANLLVSRGVRFRTLEYLPIAPSYSPILLPFKPASYREEGYVFTGQDFLGSLLQARQVLNTLPGRAALGFGGIIARIAREIIDPNSFLDGPSKEATFARHGFRLVTADGKGEFWDDDLSEHELAIICGTYVMYTGSGKQTTTVSWFPPPKAWKGNSYDSVEWTPMAEHIFQDVFSNARRGAFQPLSAKRWRDLLRGFKLPRMALSNNIDRSATFLDGQPVEKA